MYYTPLMMRQIKVTNVYNHLHNSKKTIVINRGGTRSSKSYSLAQYMIYKLTNEQNRKILIARKTFPALKETAMMDVIKLLQDYGYYNYCEHNKTDHSIIYKPTGTYIKFISIDNPEKIRSTGWNYAWLEEATEFSFDDYMTIKMRLSEPTDSINQIYLSFNPTDAFSWIKTELVDKEDVDEIVSTYRDNPFLPKEYVIELEKMKVNKAYWKVFGEGEWGSLENIIYTNWDIVDTLPVAGETIYGLDFGYNNPTAIVECRITDTGIYLQQKLYRSYMTNSDLIEWIKQNLPPNSKIYCDVAEPNRIEELRRADINALKSDKSVKDGLDYCKRQILHILNSSTDLIKELRGYQYKEKNGHPIDEPVPFNDHLLDAMRYALYTHLGKQKQYTVVI